ncbi:MAG: AbrB/MazE/SpoVT family DNA-binding domain-containing protein [Phenylobacterium sp.]|uniref:AbrB/MazE/SpoVT family DNA-binding domain-containing protein n=1 Tax=Phenylobacterium sp. TaxID=1871053 RepID=UPI002716E181|nr:AbrB/MazE/SpoVT family DNA-binding domain-containing protein [Phenylobacterium sp.]MDO8411504.1 AbrB/MazE/SpoVT family DNA-binding domain-containing protein [Phenylobacterium sp.]
MITSKLTSSGRTTIPRAVRAALDLKPGDRLTYLVEGDRVMLSKRGHIASDPFATFSEWHADADYVAYGSL